MSDSSAKQIEMFNEYIAALERQVKSIQTQRESLFQQITKNSQLNQKSNIELITLKTQIKELNALLYNQSVDKANLENQVKFLAQNNDKLKTQAEFHQKKVMQLNNTLNEKTDLLAKQKNSNYMSTNHHSKQIQAFQEKAKSLQHKLNNTLEEKIFLNIKLSETEEQLLKQREISHKNAERIALQDKQIEALQFRVSAFQHDLLEANQQKEGFFKKLAQTQLLLNDSRKQVHQLSEKMLMGNLSNEQTRKSYQTLIQNTISKYEQEIFQQVALISSKIQSIQNLNRNIQQKSTQISTLSGTLKEKDLQIKKFSNKIQQNKTEIQVLSQIINQKNNQIESIKNELAEEKSNLVTEFEKSTKLSQQIVTEFEKSTKLSQQVVQMSQQIVQMSLKIEELKAEMQQQIHHKNSSLSDKEKQYIDLEQKLSNLQEMYEFKCHEEQQINQQLKLKTNQYQIKASQCQSLNLKISQLINEIEDYKHGIENLGSQKVEQSQRLKSKLQNLDEELVELRKKQAKISKTLKDTDEKLSKTLEEMSSFKQSSDKASSELKKRLKQLEKELDYTKLKLQQKQQNLQGLGSETDFKAKQFANRQQQNARQIAQLEAKYSKLKAKLAQTEKDLDSKDTQYNRQIQKLIVEHKNQLKAIKKQSEQDLRLLQLKLQQQISALNIKLSAKEKELKETETELDDLKEQTKHKISSSLTSMEKKTSMHHIQLEDTKRQLTISHQNLTSFQMNLNKMKEQILERDIKIEGMSIQLEKAKKDNAWLISEGESLREQIEALENSTLYLKKQITSTLDQQQKSLKQIRSLKQSNRQMSKLFSSGVVPVKRSRERAESAIVLEGNRSGFGTEALIRKSDFGCEFNVNSLVQKRLYGSSYKRSSKMIAKQQTESVPSSDNTSPGNEKKETEVSGDSLTGRDMLEQGEFMPPSIISSSYYSSEEQGQK